MTASVKSQSTDRSCSWKNTGDTEGKPATNEGFEADLRATTELQGWMDDFRLCKRDFGGLYRAQCRVDETHPTNRLKTDERSKHGYQEESEER